MIVEVDGVFVCRPVRLEHPLQDMVSNVWAATETGCFLSMHRQGVPSPPGTEKKEGGKTHWSRVVLGVSLP